MTSPGPAASGTTANASGRSIADGRGARPEPVRVEDGEALAEHLHLAVVADPTGHAVHRADELGDERRRRLPVDVLRGVELLELAGVHDADPVGDRQRLGLVVGDEQRRDPEPLLEAADLSTQLWRTRASSADSGSSSSSTVGSIASARAIATRCCWPPDSWCG